uniref:Uncharacterized protein n=1 Tax=Plectus sambesii TaxID=2011161 RepID=A0A914WDY9_9BILA
MLSSNLEQLNDVCSDSWRHKQSPRSTVASFACKDRHDSLDACCYLIHHGPTHGWRVWMGREDVRQKQMDALAEAEQPSSQSIGGRHLVFRIIAAQRRRRAWPCLCRTMDRRAKADRRFG